MKNQMYTIFEDDQVLRADHLNELRSYLDEQDRATRTHLSGIGIVCGLNVENLDSDTIRITGGVGVTSRGYLVSMPTTDCTHIRRYTDPGTIQPDPGGSEAGIYPLFKDSEGDQILLWELLALEEDEAAGPDMHKINLGTEGTMVDEDSGEVVHFEDYSVLLYLEIKDEDLEDCFGDDCDENGVRRNLNWRKLLIRTSDLEDIIRERRNLGVEVNLSNEVNVCQRLDAPYVERLGYYQGRGSSEGGSGTNLSLKNYYRFEQLAQDYRSIVEKASVRVGKALHKSYEMFHPLLSDLYTSHPFEGFEIENTSENGLFKRISEEIRFKPPAIQYAYDFLKDLVDAYDEFCEVACEVAAVCRPNSELFPRHLMLDLAEPIQGEKQSPYRHYFKPSPILEGHRDLKSKARHLHQRLVEMVEQFEVDIEEDDEIRITPSKTASEPIGERSIPYYYNVDDALKLLRLWNYQKMRRDRFQLIPSYHADEYAERTEVQTAMRDYEKYPFLRVEGHIGRKYETVLGELEDKQDQLNVPIKVVGVKLSRTFSNTKVSYECRFDDLQDLYETFKTELQCLLDEEIQFFRSLEVKKKATSEEEKEETTTGTSGTGITGMHTLAGESYMHKTVEKMFPYDSPITGERRYPEETKPNTFGYIYDSFVSKAEAGKNFLDVALNIDPGLIKLDPSRWIFLFMKPAQLANNIQKLLKTLPKRLEDLEIDTLEAAYEQVIQTAREYRDQLKKSAENGEELEGKEQIIVFRLDKLIYSCSIKKLRELYRIYQDRIKEAKKMNLFSNFASRHSGMEHMGGVHKGGTLVLVYIDRNEEPLGGDRQVTEPVPARQPELENIERLRRISGRTGIRERQLFSYSDKKEIDQQFNVLFKELQHISAEKGIDIDQKKWADLGRGIRDKIEVLPEPEVDEMPPDNVVVADFALPYLCKSDCPELATMVISQFSFSLSRSQFCKRDESKYPFNTHPEGGVVESSAGGVFKEGDTWYFRPSDADVEGEEVQFTYRVNNQTVVYNAKVFNPQADFDFDVKTLDDGTVEVSFTNKSTGAQSYEWSFGDGESSTNEDPVHQYQNFDNETAVVTLKASKFDCSDEVIKQVDIPQQVEVEFRLLDARFEDETYILCGNDEPYQFVTKPEGKPITGDNIGVISGGDNKRYLAPQKYNPGSYTLEYQGESIDVNILPVGPVDFGIDYIERGTAFAEVELINESKGKVVKWIVNGTEYDESQPRHTFRNTGQPHKISLEVEFDNGCRNSIEKSITIEFAGEPDEPDQPEDDFNVIDVNIDGWIEELENYRNDDLDEELFDGDNPLYATQVEYLSQIKEAFRDEATYKRYVSGGMNADIAGSFRKMLTSSFRAVGERAQTQFGEYLLGFYKMQLKQLLNLVLGQTQDIDQESEIGKLLMQVIKQLKELSQLELNIDPNGTFAKMISEIQRTAKAQGKNNFLKILKGLEDTI